MPTPLRPAIVKAALTALPVGALLLGAVPAGAAWKSADYCAALSQLIAAAPDRFRAVSTTESSYAVDGERRAISLVELPDATLCTISATTPHLLECTYHTGILPVAEEVYAKLVRQVATCMGGRDRGPARPDEETDDTSTFATDDGTRVTVDKSDLFGEEVVVRVTPSPFEE